MPYPPNTHFHFHDMIIGRPTFDQPRTVTPQARALYRQIFFKKQVTDDAFALQFACPES
jgi:hypothetical protein